MLCVIAVMEWVVKAPFKMAMVSGCVANGHLFFYRGRVPYAVMHQVSAPAVQDGVACVRNIFFC